MDSQESQEDCLTQHESVGLLIEIIQNFEYLYDLSHKEYKNVLKKEQAWEEIAAVLKLPAKDCQKMWKSLRDRFTREKREFGKSGSPAADSKWIYFDKMQFYVKYTKPRRTYTMTPKGERPPSAASSCSNASVWSTVDSIMSPGNSDTEKRPDPNSKATPKSGSSKKRKIEQEEGEVLTMARELTSTLKNRAPLNANRTFADYVFTQLEELPRDEAKIKRKQIIDILHS